MKINHYLDHMKEIQLKVGEYEKDFSKKDGRFIKLRLINLNTLYDGFPRDSVLIGISKMKRVREIPLIVFILFYLGHRKIFLMRVNLRISNKTMFLREKVKKNIEKEV
jgi:hypothetical protein